MKLRRGYVLLGLLLFFTVLGLSGTVAVLEQDTRLKRLSEDELKLNLNALRRGIDLFRFHYPDKSHPTRIKLEDYLKNANTSAGIASLTGFLAEKSFIRQRADTVNVDRHKRKIEWQTIENLIFNSSFEIDNHEIATDADFGEWHGNHTANDGIPNGWKLKAGGAEQKIKIDRTGTGIPIFYIISFWARAENPDAGATMTVKVDGSTILNLNANSTEWKRYFNSFPLTDYSTDPDPAIVSIELSTDSSDATYIDGLMLERWKGANNADVKAPSAWTEKYQIVASATDEALQERSFKTELLPDPTITNIAKYSHRWFQW